MEQIFTEINQSQLRYKFDSLEDKCLYYRSLTSAKKLQKNSYVMLMLDGHSFSTKIKNRFKKPFDKVFIDIMDNTAKYVCSEISNAKLAYVQSDEISILLTDIENEEVSPFFDYRLCKIISIASSIATSYFNRAIVNNLLKTPCSSEDMAAIIANEPLYQFDCKCWLIPDTIDTDTNEILATAYNNVFAWFLFRQIDCVRNSKQQTAQTYCKHTELEKHTCDEQLEILKQKTGIDWYSDSEFNDGMRYGRFIYKENIEKEKNINGETKKFTRSVWNVHFAKPLYTEDGENMFRSFDFIPIKITHAQKIIDREYMILHLRTLTYYSNNLFDNVLSFYDMCINNDIYINPNDITGTTDDNDDVITIKIYNHNKSVEVVFFKNSLIINTDKLWCHVKDKQMFIEKDSFTKIPDELYVPLYEIKNNKQYNEKEDCR